MQKISKFVKKCSHRARVGNGSGILELVGNEKNRAVTFTNATARDQIE